MKLFENSTSISDAQLDIMFSKKKDSEMDLILRALSITLYQNSQSTDIIELYKLLGPEKFSQVLMILDGRPTKLPSSVEFRESLILALVYYYKEIKLLDWEQIKAKFPFEISGISYGIRIKQLSNFIRQKMDEYLRQIDSSSKKENNEP